MKKIPKVIHYCWFGGNPLPNHALRCIESWKNKCPDYEIKKWDETNFNINGNQYIKEAYKTCKWAFVSDYARLKIIYEYGGIYLDTDVELLKGLDNLLEYEGFMGFEDEKHINTGLGFGAIKNNKVIKKMMEDYERIPFIIETGNYDLTTCPIRNTRVLTKNGIIANNTLQIIDNVIYLPNDYFNPKNYDTGDINITNNTYSIHHFDSSWMSEEDKKLDKRRKKYTKIFGGRLGKFIFKIGVFVKTYGFFGVLKKVIKKFFSM
jgi:mannosyltransferase OCH1-like enzyme